MTRILLRAGKSPFTQLSPEVSLEGFSSGVWGSNVGNFIFSDSVHRLLATPDTEIRTNAFLTERIEVPGSYIKRINNEFDHFVIPMANAFRGSFLNNLKRLTNVIEQLDIPVTVVGVGVTGGKGTLNDPIPHVEGELADEVNRFMRAVLARSASIGVRGNYTAEFLSKLGYGDDVVRIIGCPSLFKFGPEHQVNKKVETITADSAVTMNLTPYVPEMGPISLHHAKHYNDLTYIPQVSNDLAMMMWGKANPQYKNPKLPIHVQHPLYLEDKMRFFVDSHSWTNYLATRDFAFGTRIHGNIAALISGTPAFVLAHDSRTHELAEYHDIPHIKVPDLAGRKDAAEFYEEADYTAFNRNQAANFERFAAFLTENGLSHVYEEGKANPEYDARIEELNLIEPVRSLAARDPEAQSQAYSRVQRLRNPEFQAKTAKKALASHEFPLTVDGKLERKRKSALRRVARKLESLAE
ncbi:polysaccharide pyruvyl transferase family protein [Populibacterium corticicola]|uniref:Polysaccharide pyruvyl transferase family protein n=1 Tax=Populibacterium corticicola TaxID=1812826 RepID=A0ABW5XB04_9MICO